MIKRKTKTMDKEIEIDGHTLYVEYEEIQEDQIVGINEGFEITKVIILKSEEIDRIKNHLKDFENESWKELRLKDLRDNIMEDYSIETMNEIWEISYLKDFCKTEKLVLTSLRYSLLKFITYKLHSFEYLEKAGNSICEFINVDIDNIDITQIIDHSTVENYL